MEFKEYLLQKGGVKAKKLPFYLQWVNKYHFFCQQNGNNDSIWNFQKSLLEKYTDWQIEQAEDAVKHYIYFKNHYKKDTDRLLIKSDNNPLWVNEKKTFREALRLKHRSYQTEKSYVRWLESFRIFLRTKKAEDLTEEDIKSFLTYLAVEKEVSNSTQNQVRLHTRAIDEVYDQGF